MAAMVRMTEEDLEALRAAAATLEHPGLAARLGNIAGKPIELLGRALPEAASKAVAAATTKALNVALAVALRTMEKEPKAASRLLHKALAAASGAVGGVNRRCRHAAAQILDLQRYRGGEPSHVGHSNRIRAVHAS